MGNFYDDTEKGRPVVLLHAFPLERRMWRPQIGPLSEAGYRVIVPDLPGFGRNTEFSDRMPMDETADSIKLLIDDLRIERAIVVGLSMGGYVALSLYHSAPELFAGLVLCDTTAAADTAEKKASRAAQILDLEKSGSRILVDQMLKKLVSDHTVAERPETVDEIEKMMLAADPRAAAAALRGMASRPDRREMLKEISVPTALIFGEHDRVADLAQARRMEDLIPGARLFVIEDAGHLSNLEQPDRFNRALLDFCSRVKF
jgi:pimeloyl-ACP methyl ester carboxylesterase